VADTPDQDVLSAKGGNGFPTLFFMEPETGAVLNEWWWPEDEKTVREALAKATEKAGELKQLLRAAEKAPEDKKVQATLKLRLAMMCADGSPSLTELAELAQTEGLDPALKTEFAAWLAGRRVQEALETASKKATKRSEFNSLAEEAFYGLLKDGVRLAPEHDMAQMFYDLGLNGAVAKGDREVAQAAFAGLEQSLKLVLESRPDAEADINKAIDEAKARLKKLDEAKKDG
jgi:hypothetical protein